MVAHESLELIKENMKLTIETVFDLSRDDMQK